MGLKKKFKKLGKKKISPIFSFFLSFVFLVKFSKHPIQILYLEEFIETFKMMNEIPVPVLVSVQNYAVYPRKWIGRTKGNSSSFDLTLYSLHKKKKKRKKKKKEKKRKKLNYFSMFRTVDCDDHRWHPLDGCRDRHARVPR